MTLEYRKCSTEAEWARVSLFLLQWKRDLSLAMTTLEMVTIIHSYVTSGHLLYVTNEENRIVGAGAYYIGTPERDFQDKEVALADLALSDRAYRGTRLFVQGLLNMVNLIQKEHPGVEEFRLAALKDNEYLCRLYSKFTKAQYTRDGRHGQEVVFCEKIHTLKAILGRFYRL